MDRFDKKSITIQYLRTTPFKGIFTLPTMNRLFKVHLQHLGSFFLNDPLEDMITTMSIPPAPVLHPINTASVISGYVVISWSEVKDATYYLYRDVEPVTNVAGWFPYAIIEHGKTTYEDHNLHNHQQLFYAVQAVWGGERSPLSNSIKLQIHYPDHITVDPQEIQKVAYLESQKGEKYEVKVWTYARLVLIIEMTFPNRSWDYLERHVKCLKDNLPEFKGIIIEPTESQIRQRAQQIYESHLSPMELDWTIAELQLILQKIHELIEFESCVR